MMIDLKKAALRQITLQVIFLWIHSYVNMMMNITYINMSVRGHKKISKHIHIAIKEKFSCKDSRHFSFFKPDCCFTKLLLWYWTAQKYIFLTRFYGYCDVLYSDSFPKIRLKKKCNVSPCLWYCNIFVIYHIVTPLFWFASHRRILANTQP